MDTTIDIGTGIYSVPDAARILHLDSRKLGQWLRKYWELEFLRDFPDGPSTYIKSEGREKVFNFHTLIEMIAVAKFRDLGVTFQTIKQAHHNAAELLKTSYPFAMEGFMTDRKNIFHNQDPVVSVNLDQKRQYAFRKLIEPYCEKIDFDHTTKLAERYWPLGKDHAVVVDPNHRFGEPVINGTNISTSIIYNLHKAGEPALLISEEYGIPEVAVLDAITFHKQAS